MDVSPLRRLKERGAEGNKQTRIGETNKSGIAMCSETSK